MRSALVFTAIMLAVMAIGGLFQPGTWYQGLVKPSWTPPPAAFAIWLPLYAAIGVAGWRLWRAPAVPARRVALWLWAAQLGLNALWTPLFFGLHQPLAALGLILALFAVICAGIGWFRAVDRPASWLFVPYALWVGFAASLNGAIVALNGA